MTIKQMNERRKELGYSYEKLSELSGVPVGTVQKVLGGITKSPRYETLNALERILEPRELLMVKESICAYGGKKPGEYTIDDYYAMPDEQRVELIDGVLYDMAAPTFIHQSVAMEICARLREFIRGKNGSCVPGISPLDVQLDRDDKTIVQPDVLVVCDRSKIVKGRVYGAPDFVVEILSPSTLKRDKTLKVHKYMSAGVREYWIVDIKKQSIIVYAADGEEDYDIFLYSFQDKVPMNIFNNECEIDFKEIYDYIAFMYEK